MIAVAKGVVCGAPIRSTIRDVFLQFFDQVTAWWAMFPVGLRGLRSFAITPVSAATLNVIINALRPACLHSIFFVFGIALHMVVHRVFSVL